MRSRADSGQLRQRLRDRSAPLIGTFVLLPRVEIVEALAHTGFDVVILDFEHGPFGVAELSPLVAAAQGAGSDVIVRVEDVSQIGPVLDTGVDGVLLPHVGSAADASALAQAVQFPPAGTRSINPYVRAAWYGTDESYLTDRIATIVMIEGKDGLDALPDIAAVPGVDAIFVGPVDLSAALGFPGEPEHPRVVETIAEIVTTLTSANVAAAMYCPTPAAARRWLDAGAQFVAVSADTAMAIDGFQHVLRGVR